MLRCDEQPRRTVKLTIVEGISGDHGEQRVPRKGPQEHLGTQLVRREVVPGRHPAAEPPQQRSHLVDDLRSSHRKGSKGGPEIAPSARSVQVIAHDRRQLGGGGVIPVIGRGEPRAVVLMSAACMSRLIAARSSSVTRSRGARPTPASSAGACSASSAPREPRPCCSCAPIDRHRTTPGRGLPLCAPRARASRPLRRARAPRSSGRASAGARAARRSCATSRRQRTSWRVPSRTRPMRCGYGWCAGGRAAHRRGRVRRVRRSGVAAGPAEMARRPSQREAWSLALARRVLGRCCLCPGASADAWARRAGGRGHRWPCAAIGSHSGACRHHTRSKIGARSSARDISAIISRVRPPMALAL